MQHDNSRRLADARRPLLDDSQRVRCEIWTRVMGYHRPVSSFNAGKQGEFHERRFFVESRN
ncbi:ribonucleoside-triphosphate reductase [Achromobacter sp. DMS1]|nr:ribonucleoside-triphosphate reductase [Achromobacter sp. DMS1]